MLVFFFGLISCIGFLALISFFYKKYRCIFLSAARGFAFAGIFFSAARGFAFAVFFFPLRGALLLLYFSFRCAGLCFCRIFFPLRGALVRGTDVFLMDRTVLVQYIGESKKNLHVLGVSQVKRVLGT